MNETTLKAGETISQIIDSTGGGPTSFEIFSGIWFVLTSLVGLYLFYRKTTKGFQDDIKKEFNSEEFKLTVDKRIESSLETNNLQEILPLKTKFEMIDDNVKYNRTETTKQWDRITPMENSIEVLKAELKKDREDNKDQHDMFLKMLDKIDKTSTETNIKVAKIAGALEVKK